MFQKNRVVIFAVCGVLSLLLWGCATADKTGLYRSSETAETIDVPAKPVPQNSAEHYRSLDDSELIDTLRHERIETLYYSNYPENFKELMLRDDAIFTLVDAYNTGGDDLFRFNVIIILNHIKPLTDAQRDAISQCLCRAVKDTSPWVRTEAVWGLGLSPEPVSVPVIIPLLDDPDPHVVNEAILSLAKITGIRHMPVSNENMPVEERRKAVDDWKRWWKKVSVILNQPISEVPGTKRQGTSRDSGQKSDRGKLP